MNTVPPASLTLTSGRSDSSDNYVMVMVGDRVTFTCTLVLNSTIEMSEVSSLLTVSTQLTHPNGAMLSLSSTTTGITIIYTTTVNSFGRSDSGNYTCSATVGAQPSAMYLTGIDDSSDALEVTTGNR